MKKKENEIKTNVMRILDKNQIDYEVFALENAEGLTGKEVAMKLNENTKEVFKTLVTVANSKEHYVFMIPVEEELDLKKAAKAVGEKNIEMIKSKELLPLTGYIHGGCSPIGMKKRFITVIDNSAMNFDKIYFSAGKIGVQIRMKHNELNEIIDLSWFDLIK